jgi:hypothetical protein
LNALALILGRVTVELSACGELSEATVREHLALELSTLDLSAADARLALRCERSSVLVELRRASGERYPIEVRVELRGTAEGARERLIALAASELVAQAERAREDAKTRERAQQSAASVPAARRAARGDAPSRPPAPERARRVELWAAGSAALDGKPGGVLWGGSLGTSLGIGRRWSVLLDTRVERGGEALPLADVRWTVLSGFAGAGGHAVVGPLQLTLGFGARVGWLSLAADAAAPNEGRSFTAPWAGVAAPFRLALDWGGGLAPFLGAEAGLVTLPVRGRASDRSLLVEQRGSWLAVSLGFVIAL